jgi:hypothetical protein
LHRDIDGSGGTREKPPIVRADGLDLPLIVQTRAAPCWPRHGAFPDHAFPASIDYAYELGYELENEYLGQRPGSEWSAINWAVHERNVARLRQRIFTATRDGDLAEARNLQKLMLRSWSNTLVMASSVR